MSFVINRAIEWTRRSREPARSLRARAAQIRDRKPLVVVPSILGTRILDERGGVLWGSLPRLYFGPAIAHAPRATAAGTLDGFAVVPGLFRYDIYGGLLRYLAGVGGYTHDRDLYVLEYDWRESVSHGAARLAELVARVRAAGHRGGVDLLAISSGGLVARHFLAGTNEAIGRVVYVGTPHRGTFQAIAALHDGIQMVPLGRRFSAVELAACQTCWDSLPHPDEAVFVDDRGAALPDSLYDARTWRALRLGPPVEIEAYLERALGLHRALDAAPVHADSVVIGARHLPTLSKLPVVRGRAVLPPCSPRRGDPLARVLFEPGDSSLPARSLVGLPGLAAGAIRTVVVDEHRLLPSHGDVHRLAVEALLESAS